MTGGARSCHLRTIDHLYVLTPEQHRYLRDGIRARARFYGGFVAPIPEDDALTLVLAWHAAYWREQADRADARNRDCEMGGAS